MLLRVQVTPEGKAGQVTIESSSGSPTLDAAASNKVMRDCRFVPATLNGVPATGDALVPMRFSFKDIQDY